jgi:hypothetical protein
VRALDIQYEDPAAGTQDGPHFAFLIEDLSDVARRSGHKRVRTPTFATRQFDALGLGRFMLFQYLIGNTDWEVLSGAQNDSCCHNVRVIGSDPSAGLVAVPYDFDSAGMVDADYAAPAPQLSIQAVTQRLFRGFCRHNDALLQARQEFLAQRAQIFGLIQSEPRLSAARRKVLARYFESFYAALESESRFAREISGKCRK